jgi:hypothetical protein
VPTFQFCANQKEAYETIATYTRSDFRKKVILESLPPIDFRQDNRFPQETNSKLKFISYRPNLSLARRPPFSIRDFVILHSKISTYPTSGLKEETRKPARINDKNSLFEIEVRKNLRLCTITG